MKESNFSNSSDKFEAQRLIQEFITVGIGQKCKKKSIQTEYKWITSIELLDQQTKHKKQIENQIKPIPTETTFLELYPNLFLEIHFCEEGKKPITRIRTFTKPSEQWIKLDYPSKTEQFEQFICYKSNSTESDRRIIQDIEFFSSSNKEDDKLSEICKQTYEIVRIPAMISEKSESVHQCSDEQLQESQNISYLIIKTIDLEDQQREVQTYEPAITNVHRFQHATTKIDYETFANYCFPHGVKLHSSYDGCGYQIFNFILTEEDGERLYVNCLKLKEEIDEDLKIIFQESKSEQQIYNQDYFNYYEKAVCIVSRYCFTDFFGSTLEDIYRKFYSNILKKNVHKKHKIHQYMENIERFDEIVSSFINSIENASSTQKSLKLEQSSDFYEEEKRFKVQWDDSLITFPNVSRYHDFPTPVSSQAIYCLFKMLSIDNIMHLLESTLLEKKIFFVSDSQKALGFIIQALVSFMYPLKWQHVILPIVPVELIDYIEAPFPIIAGLSSNLINQQILQLKGVFVFLDCNEILVTDDNKNRYCVSHLKETKKKISTYNVFSQKHLSDFITFKDTFYIFTITFANQKLFSSEHIRNIFFQMMILLLKDYDEYYRQEYLGENKQKLKSFNFKKGYRSSDFAKSHSKSLQSFMGLFCETTIFANFIHRKYSLPDNPEIMFVDKAIAQNKLLYSKEEISPKKPRISLNQSPDRSLNLTRKNVSLPPQNILSSLDKRAFNSSISKSEKEDSTHYTKHQKPSLQNQDVIMENEDQHQRQKEKKTKASNICEIISQGVRKLSKAGSRALIWTSARVKRLKKSLDGHQKKRSQQKQLDKNS